MTAVIQYASDLHIDEWATGTNFFGFITPSAPILVLAGDICPVIHPFYDAFIKWASANWYLVIVVAGNHEYYGLQTMESVDRRLYDISKQYNNVIYLQHGAHYVVPGTRLCFIGATYWSAIDPSIWNIAVEKKGDCKNIYDAPARRAHPSALSAIHSRHRALIASAIGNLAFRGLTLIVVTHHMPTEELLEPEYREEMWRSFYASADDDMLVPQIAAWICGHGHRATTYRAPSGCLVVMNARGYNSEAEQSRTRDVYNARATIRVGI